MEVSEPRPPAAFDVRSRSRVPLFVAAGGVLLVAFVLLIAGAPAVQRAAVTPTRTLPAAPLGLGAAPTAVRCGVAELAGETLSARRQPAGRVRPRCNTRYLKRP